MTAWSLILILALLPASASGAGPLPLPAPELPPVDEELPPVPGESGAEAAPATTTPATTTPATRPATTTPPPTRGPTIPTPPPTDAEPGAPREEQVEVPAPEKGVDEAIGAAVEPSSRAEDAPVATTRQSAPRTVPLPAWPLVLALLAGLAVLRRSR